MYVIKIFFYHISLNFFLKIKRLNYPKECMSFSIKKYNTGIKYFCMILIQNCFYGDARTVED